MIWWCWFYVTISRSLFCENSIISKIFHSALCLDVWNQKSTRSTSMYVLVPKLRAKNVSASLWHVVSSKKNYLWVVEEILISRANFQPFAEKNSYLSVSLLIPFMFYNFFVFCRLEREWKINTNSYFSFYSTPPPSYRFPRRWANSHFLEVGVDD